MVEQKDKQLWFPHDLNAKDDPKIVILIDELGLEGYGAFWVIIETLRAQKGYKLQLKALDALSRRYNTSPQKMRVVIEAYELFIIENDEFFFSPSLLRRMQVWEEKKEIARENGKKGALVKKEKHDAQVAKILGFSPQDSTKDSLSNPLAITQHNNVLDINYSTTQTLEQEIDDFFEYIMQNSKKEIISRGGYKIKLQELYNKNDTSILNDLKIWRQYKADTLEIDLLLSLRGVTINYNNLPHTIIGVEKSNQNEFKIFFTNDEIYHCPAAKFYQTFRDFDKKSAS